MEWADTRVTHLTYFDRLATTVELLGSRGQCSGRSSRSPIGSYGNY